MAAVELNDKTHRILLCVIKMFLVLKQQLLLTYVWLVLFVFFKYHVLLIQTHFLLLR